MSRAQPGEGGSVEARAGAVKEDGGPLRESKKARVWGRGWGDGQEVLGVELVMGGDGEVVRPLK